MGQNNIPNELKYTKEHEWVHLSNDIASIGITDFAQSQLGDIVFVELPEVGAVLSKDQPFGVVESIKSVSDLYSPLTGEVTEINDAIIDSPEMLNQGCYDNWMVKVKISSTEEASELLNAEAYASLCQD